VAPAPMVSGPVASGPVASGPVAPAPAPRPAPVAKKSKLPLILLALVLLFFLCAGVPAVGWVAYSYLGLGASYSVPEIPVPQLPQSKKTHSASATRASFAHCRIRPST